MVTRLVALLSMASGCSLARDLDYLGEGLPGGPLPDLCPGGGWCVLPDTKLRPHCPDSNAEHDYDFTCPEVIATSNGAVYDPTGHRLVIWGGGAGETGHFGNEIYALSIAEGRMSRLTDPSPTPACTPALPDGTPHPRSMRDGLAFADGAMLLFGGESACGYWHDTWRLDLETVTWTELAPAGPVGCDPLVQGSCSPDEIGIMAARDPLSGAVFVKDPYRFWRYDPAANRFELLRDDVPTSYAMTARIDPDRRLFVYVGCLLVSEGCIPSLGAVSIDPATQYANSDWSDEQSGCDALMEADGPGFAFDARQRLFVGWPNTGGSVVLLDPETRSCTTRAFAGGPPPANHASGTFGRFRYMPELDAFVVVNDVDNDAYVLRL